MSHIAPSVILVQGRSISSLYSFSGEERSASVLSGLWVCGDTVMHHLDSPLGMTDLLFQLMGVRLVESPSISDSLMVIPSAKESCLAENHALLQSVSHRMMDPSGNIKAQPSCSNLGQKKGNSSFRTPHRVDWDFQGDWITAQLLPPSMLPSLPFYRCWSQ